MRASIIVVFILGLGGCLSLPPQFIPIASSGEMVEAETLGEVRTAKDGDIVFSQDISGGKLVLLQENVVIEKAGAFQPEYNVPKGSLLQSGIILSEVGDGSGFCTVELTNTRKTPFGETFNSRSCFLDSDNDGTFEYVFEGASGFSGLFSNNEYVIEEKGFQSSSLTASSKLETPISYSPSDQTLQTEAKIFVFFYAQGENRGRFKMYSDVGGVRNELENGYHSLSGQYPETFNLSGIEMEVVSVEGDSLKYRVLKSIPVGTPISTDIGFSGH